MIIVPQCSPLLATLTKVVDLLTVSVIKDSTQRAQSSFSACSFARLQMAQGFFGGWGSLILKFIFPPGLLELEFVGIYGLMNVSSKCSVVMSGVSETPQF